MPKDCKGCVGCGACDEAMADTVREGHPPTALVTVGDTVPPPPGGWPATTRAPVGWTSVGTDHE